MCLISGSYEAGEIQHSRLPLSQAQPLCGWWWLVCKDALRLLFGYCLFLELENARNNPYRNLKSVAVETKSALEKLYANYKSEVCIMWSLRMFLIYITSQEKKEGKEGKEKATRKNAVSRI